MIRVRSGSGGIVVDVYRIGVVVVTPGCCPHVQQKITEVPVGILNLPLIVRQLSVVLIVRLLLSLRLGLGLILILTPMFVGLTAHHEQCGEDRQDDKNLFHTPS